MFAETLRLRSLTQTRPGCGSRPAASDGRDARDFLVGGFSTLRGFGLYEVGGTRVVVVNAELRFPFIDRLGVVGPVPLGALALRGALFADGFETGRPRCHASWIAEAPAACTA